MKYNIRKEALTCIQEYLNTTDTVRYGFSKEETDVIFPTMASLFDFGHLKYGSTRPPGPNYEWLREMARRDQVQARNMALTHKDLLKKLMHEYQAAESGQQRHSLFSTPIGSMTGYQFEEYLKEIGILKPTRDAGKNE